MTSSNFIYNNNSNISREADELSSKIPVTDLYGGPHKGLDSNLQCYNNFIKKYAEASPSNDVITNKSNTESSAKVLRLDEEERYDIEYIDTDKALEMDDIRYTPLPTYSTENEGYDDFKNMCIICGEVNCICYQNIAENKTNCISSYPSYENRYSEHLED